MEEQLWQLFAVYGCNGTEFSYVIFAEQRNSTMAKRQRKNGNGMVETGRNSIKLCHTDTQTVGFCLSSLLIWS